MEADTPVVDIHQHRKTLNRELERIAHDSTLTAEQRRTILRFISDARCGRTVRKGAKRRISDGRCVKMIFNLRRFAREIGIPFEAVTVDDMERFILGLEDGRIGKTSGIHAGTQYTPGSVLDMKKVIRKFYQWLCADDENKVKQLTTWFDTREVLPELKTFGLPEAERLARAAGSPQGQALVMTLFDGGPRAGEWRNLRLVDVRFQPDTDGVETLIIRIRISKTTPRTISLPLATDAVKFWIERHPEGGTIGPDGYVQARNPSALLFTWTYHYVRKLLRQLGRAELNERLWIHQFRHCSATFYSRYLREYQLKARYGWSMGSDVAKRYVDRNGVLAQETASIVRREMGRTFSELATIKNLTTRQETIGTTAPSPEVEQSVRSDWRRCA